MAFTKATTITSWSFSRYNQYHACPRKAKLQFIDKIKSPGNAAMDRGAKIHDKAEAYLKGEGRNVPKELKEFAPMMKRLRKQFKKAVSGMQIENTWAFTEDWTETVWNDWAKCWVRIKLDCCEEVEDDTLLVYDWKTGKFREDNIEDYIEQLELYALGALLQLPHIEVVRPQLIYLDYGITYPSEEADIKALTFTRKDIPRLKKLWAKRVKPMLKDKAFAPLPNRYCYNCHFRKANTPNLPNKIQLCEY